jgi:hypothetical protein
VAKAERPFEALEEPPTWSCNIKAEMVWRRRGAGERTSTGEGAAGAGSRAEDTRISSDPRAPALPHPEPACQKPLALDHAVDENCQELS